MPKQTPAARAEAEAKAGDKPVPVKWKGKTWHVLPVAEWDKSWRRHLRTEDWDSWAECVLPSAEHDAWFNTPAKSSECLAFIDAWTAASGQDAGESTAS